MTDNKEAVEAVRKLICVGYHRRPCQETCVSCEKRAVRALAAARPFLMEEAARIAEGRGHNVKLFHDQPAERFASTSEIAAAIRAAKETGG